MPIAPPAGISITVTSLAMIPCAAGITRLRLDAISARERPLAASGRSRIRVAAGCNAAGRAPSPRLSPLLRQGGDARAPC
jgi:hypothetical protein